jgi:tetratricopeptide (TPR) repeat protein
VAVTDILKMRTLLDLASAYSDAGLDSESLAAFRDADSLISSLGWQETQTAVTFLNDWALELDQIGLPLEAEPIEHRAIELASDGKSADAVIPITLTNYARMLRKLNRLDEASDYAQRAYDKARGAGNQIVTGQSLSERAQIAIAQKNFAAASAYLSELELLIRKNLPPTHYAFANLASARCGSACRAGITR